MQATLPQDSFSHNWSAVDWEYFHNRDYYQQLRQANVIKLRRRLIRRRARFKRNLRHVLSPHLLAELNIRVMLDHHYLQRPDFIGFFTDNEQDWIIGFQAQPLGGRWYFRSLASSKLYSCSFHQLETQLCYALGQCRSQEFPLVCA